MVSITTASRDYVRSKLNVCDGIVCSGTASKQWRQHNDNTSTAAVRDELFRRSVNVRTRAGVRRVVGHPVQVSVHSRVHAWSVGLGASFSPGYNSWKNERNEK